MKNLNIIIFSKDRAMQLHATLGSFAMHCKEASDANISIIYRASTSKHTSQYESLLKEFPNAAFFPETNFRRQLLSLLGGNHVLFLVDDNIFVRDFSLGQAVQHLTSNPMALGFSLRLGRNTTYCYSLNQAQPLPEFREAQPCNDFMQSGSTSLSLSILSFDWTKSTLDFRYPLEVSSSIYRSDLISKLLNRLNFHHPNTLEGAMAAEMSAYESSHPLLLCYEQSSTFCNPLNKVQEVVASNRYAEQLSLSADTLSDMFQEGLRIDYRRLNGFTPNSCHMEVEVPFIRLGYAAPCPQPESLQPQIWISERDSASFILASREPSEALFQTLGAITSQVYPHWDCWICCDGSAASLFRQFKASSTGGKIDRFNIFDSRFEGLAAARNSAIERSSRHWISAVTCGDFPLPNFLESKLGLADQNPVFNLIYSDCICEDHSPARVIFPDYNSVDLVYKNTLPPNALFRRSLWQRCGGYNPSMPSACMDHSFWLSLQGLGLYPVKSSKPLWKSGTKCAHIASLVDAENCLHFICSAHYNLYDANTVMQAHERISASPPEVAKEIEYNTQKFPAYPLPHLWLGLTLEAAGDKARARRSYEAAEALSADDDWQASFRLALLFSDLGIWGKAAQAIENVLVACPEFPLAAKLEHLRMQCLHRL